MNQSRIKRILFRSMFYIQQGYGRYVTWPVTFAAYASAIYYLAIKSIPFFEAIFPNFYRFVIFAAFSIIFTSGILGWMHYKGMLSKFFKAELDVQIEASPYSIRITTPVNLPWMRVISELGKRNGISTVELDRIIRETEQKFGSNHK